MAKYIPLGQLQIIESMKKARDSEAYAIGVAFCAFMDKAERNRENIRKSLNAEQEFATRILAEAGIPVEDPHRSFTIDPSSGKILEFIAGQWQEIE